MLRLVIADAGGYSSRGNSSRIRHNVPCSASQLVPVGAAMGISAARWDFRCTRTYKQGATSRPARGFVHVPSTQPRVVFTLALDKSIFQVRVLELLPAR